MCVTKKLLERFLGKMLHKRTYVLKIYKERNHKSSLALHFAQNTNKYTQISKLEFIGCATRA